MPTHRPSYYIGLMSGTSMDAVDAALVSFAGRSPTLVEVHEHVLPQSLRQQIEQLCYPGDNEIERMGQCDVLVAELFVEAVRALLKKADIGNDEVIAIGSHGQTIRHRPDIQPAFTLQIGDPNVIAEQTGILTISDFRRHDMAAGGQGAPLVPAFHAREFAKAGVARAILNIGGIANLTLLPAEGTAEVTGFDTGPGNVLVDAWTRTHQDFLFDQGGQWAASGELNQALLNQLLTHQFFRDEPPKSTGREQFNAEWLSLQLQHEQPARPEDTANTLVELTARTIISHLDTYFPQREQLFVCGGGANNNYLMQRLRALATNCEVNTTDTLGVPPDWVEATAFAWLAKQRLEDKPGNLPSVTGASKECVLGGIYHP